MTKKVRVGPKLPRKRVCRLQHFSAPTVPDDQTSVSFSLFEKTPKTVTSKSSLAINSELVGFDAPFPHHRPFFFYIPRLATINSRRIIKAAGDTFAAV